MRNINCSSHINNINAQHKKFLITQYKLVMWFESVISCSPSRRYSFWWHPRGSVQANPPDSLHQLHHSGWCRHSVCHLLHVLQYHLQKEKVSKHTTPLLVTFTIHSNTIHLHSNTTILIPIPPSSFQYHHLYSKPSILIPIPPSSFQYHHPHSNTTIFIPNHPSSFQYHHLHSKPSIIILMLYLHSNSTDCHIINPHSSLSVKFSVTRSITTRSTLMLWGQDLLSWAQLNVDVTFIGLGLDTKKCSERCWNKFKLINSPESLSHRKCLDGGSNDVPFYPIFLLQDCASDKSQPKLSDHPWNHPTVHYCHIFCFSYYWCHLPNHLLPCELLIGVWMCILCRVLARNLPPNCA